MLFPGIYYDHPERRDVVIFCYRRKEYAECLCGYLQESTIYYELYEPVKDDPRYCIAIYRKNFREALRLHELTLARNKRPFIEDSALRWFVIILFLTMLGLAITGMIISELQ